VKYYSIVLPLILFLSACSKQQDYRSRPDQRQTVSAQDAAKDDGDSILSETQDTKDQTSDAAKMPSQPSVSAPASSPPVKSSGGSGGGTGMLELPFTDSTGLASSYKINAPTDAGQKVFGLHIHLHGDGGGGYQDFPNKELRNDLIGVTIKAPNTNLQWGRAQGRPHALYVNDLIQKELLKKYPINLDRIFFSTVSGGSYFLTGSFLPEFGQLYQSAAFVMCGGEAPRVAFTDPKVLGKFRIHFEVTAGERQDIQTSVQASINTYKSAATSAGIPADQQIKLQTSTIQGAGGHCVFDGVSYTTGIQQAIDNKFKSVLPQE